MQKKILVIKTSALGDVIQCFSLLNFLNDQFPHATIDWVIENAFVSLLERHPLISKVVPVQTRKWKKNFFSLKTFKQIRKFFFSLRKEKYDLLIDLQGNIKSGLMTMCAKSKEKIGFSFKSAPEWPAALFVSFRYASCKSDPMPLQYLTLIQKHLRIKPHLVSPLVSLHIEQKEKEWIDTRVNKEKTNLMICFGSNWENKKLSLETWKQLLGNLEKKSAPFFFFVWGNEKEKEEGQRLQEWMPHQSVLLPKMELFLWQQCMAQMDGVISVDSSALHLAATVDRPTFSFFGPSKASLYKPEGKNHLAFQALCPYGKTFDKRCPILRSCSTGACLKNLSHEELFPSFYNWYTTIKSVATHQN